MPSYSYSEEGLALTKSFEGLRTAAYQDSGGVWTIGYGHTGPDVHAGMTIDDAEATALLQSDLAESVDFVDKVVTYPIQQHQFDALVDFCFNCGRGNFLNSTLLRKVNEGDFVGAAAEFGRWVHAGAEVVEGLATRRRAEAQMFMGEEAA